MVAISLLLPPLLLAGAGLVAGALGATGPGRARIPAATGAALALVALVLVWARSRAVVEVTGPVLGAGVSVDLRLDALSAAFMGLVLVPSTLLLAGQHRSPLEAGSTCLALAATCLALEAASLSLTTLALGAGGILLMLRPRSGVPGASGGAFALWQAAAWLILLWAAATLQATAGTAAYQAIPVNLFGVPVFLLLALGSLLLAGLTPWRSWIVFAVETRSPAASLAVASQAPIGFYLLFRAYDAGGGHYPSFALNTILAVLGVAIAAGAALRAQAAVRRGAFLAELVAVNAGFALFGLALGSPLALSASITVLAGQALLIPVLALTPEAGSVPVVLALLASLGLPPGIVFGGRLLAAQAGLEAGAGFGVLALVMLGAWVLSLAAAARALELPATGGGDQQSSRSWLGACLAIVALAAGAALGAIEVGVAVPAATEVIDVPAGAVGGGLTAVSSASGAWPALGFGVPLLGLGGLLVYLGRARLAKVAAARTPERLPGPLVPTGWSVRLESVLGGLFDIRLPEEYRSLFDPRALDATVSAGRPLLWVVVVAGLAYAITR